MTVRFEFSIRDLGPFPIALQPAINITGFHLAEKQSIPSEPAESFEELETIIWETDENQTIEDVCGLLAAKTLSFSLVDSTDSGQFEGNKISATRSEKKNKKFSIDLKPLIHEKSTLDFNNIEVDLIDDLDAKWDEPPPEVGEGVDPIPKKVRVPTMISFSLTVLNGPIGPAIDREGLHPSQVVTSGVSPKMDHIGLNWNIFEFGFDAIRHCPEDLMACNSTAPDAAHCFSYEVSLFGEKFKAVKSSEQIPNPEFDKTVDYNSQLLEGGEVTPPETISADIIVPVPTPENSNSGDNKFKIRYKGKEEIRLLKKMLNETGGIRVHVIPILDTMDPKITPSDATEINEKYKNGFTGWFDLRDLLTRGCKQIYSAKCELSLYTNENNIILPMMISLKLLLLHPIVPITPSPLPLIENLLSISTMNRRNSDNIQRLPQGTDICLEFQEAIYKCVDVIHEEYLVNPPDTTNPYIPHDTTLLELRIENILRDSLIKMFVQHSKHSSTVSAVMTGTATIFTAGQKKFGGGGMVGLLEGIGGNQNLAIGGNISGTTNSNRGSSSSVANNQMMDLGGQIIPGQMTMQPSHSSGRGNNTTSGGGGAAGGSNGSGGGGASNGSGCNGVFTTLDRILNAAKAEMIPEYDFHDEECKFEQSKQVSSLFSDLFTDLIPRTIRKVSDSLLPPPQNGSLVPPISTKVIEEPAVVGARLEVVDQRKRAKRSKRLCVEAELCGNWENAVGHYQLLLACPETAEDPLNWLDYSRFLLRVGDRAESAEMALKKGMQKLEVQIQQMNSLQGGVAAQGAAAQGGGGGSQLSMDRTSTEKSNNRWEDELLRACKLMHAALLANRRRFQDALDILNPLHEARRYDPMPNLLLGIVHYLKDNNLEKGTQYMSLVSRPKEWFRGLRNQETMFEKLRVFLTAGDAVSSPTARMGAGESSANAVGSVTGYSSTSGVSGGSISGSQGFNAILDVRCPYDVDNAMLIGLQRLINFGCAKLVFTVLDTREMKRLLGNTNRAACRLLEAECYSLLQDFSNVEAILEAPDEPESPSSSPKSRASQSPNNRPSGSPTSGGGSSLLQKETPQQVSIVCEWQRCRLLGEAKFKLNKFKESNYYLGHVVRVADSFDETLIDSHPHILIQLGHTYLLQNNWAAARGVFLRSVQCAGGLPGIGNPSGSSGGQAQFSTSGQGVLLSESWVGLAFAAYRQEDIRAAYEALREANWLDDSRPDVWAFLVLVHLRMGCIFQADECFRYTLQYTSDQMSDELLLEIGLEYLKYYHTQVGAGAEEEGQQEENNHGMRILGHLAHPIADQPSAVENTPYRAEAAARIALKIRETGQGHELLADALVIQRKYETAILEYGLAIRLLYDQPQHRQLLVKKAIELANEDPPLRESIEIAAKMAENRYQEFLQQKQDKSM